MKRPPLPSAAFPAILRARFSSRYPAFFAIFAVLSLVAGGLYEPNNFDALIYRMPRVAHWLMAERWEWIPTIKNNLNTRSTGFEWWTAPMICLLRTDRLIFLINWISFLFLPGIFFNVFRQLGAASRVARVWMWLLPSGYCFVLQAASVGNDMLATLFAAAAFDFGFRWKRGGGYAAFALALLSCAMMTAIKPTTLPLLLPFGCLFFGMWRPALARPLVTALLALLFALSSFLPTAVINYRKCGDWTGAAAEDAKLGKVEPLIGISTNTINTIIQNVAPPLFPFAAQWNRMFTGLFPPSYIEANMRSFEEGGAKMGVPDFQGEESAGIGSGLSLLLAGTVAAGLCMRKLHGRAPIRRNGILLTAGLFCLALLAYFSRAGMSTVARHIAPFYPFLFALCLTGKSQPRIAGHPFFRFAATAALLSSLLMLVILPSRPLWPSRSILAGVDEHSPAILRRAKTGYEVYSGRSDGLGPVRDALPADAAVVAYLSYSASPELPLWKPYMKRRLRHILPDDKPSDLIAEHIRYVVINTDRFEQMRGISPEDWIALGGGIVKNRIQVQLIARHQPSEWWIVTLTNSSR